MTANINDTFTQATNGTRPVPSVLSAIKAIGAASLAANALTGWATATAVHFILYNIDVSNNKIAGTQSDFKGIVSGSTITGIVLKAGNDANYGIGTVIEAAPTAAWANDMANGMLLEHLQGGGHGAITPTSVQASGIVNAAGQNLLQDNSIALSTIRRELFFDYIFGGTGVLTADAPGSTLNASLTGITAYQNGQRTTLAAINGRAYTANKDTYVDVLNTSGVLSVVYTEVTNNAASPVLAANSIRVAIVVSGATSIAAQTSINQGQETAILPIAASMPYQVADSLGNLICPRDPNRKLLCARYIATGTDISVSSSTAAAIAQFVMPVNVPAGRKVKITLSFSQNTSTASSNNRFEIWRGVVGSGTLVKGSFTATVTSGDDDARTITATDSPTAVGGAITYNLGFATLSTGGIIKCQVTQQAFARVELE